MTTEHDDLETRDLLLTAVPAPAGERYESWDEVLLRADVVTDGRVPEDAMSVPQRARASSRLFALRRRRWLAAGCAAAVLLVAGAAVAAVAGVPWWESAASPVNPSVVDWQLAPPADGSSFPPTADRSRARTVAEEDGAALVAAPVGEGGYCVIPSLPGSPSIGFSCVYQLGDEFRSYARPSSAGRPRWVVYGRITDPDAATLDLSPAAGVSLSVRLRPGGFFLANVPQSRWAALDGSAGEGRILDASGATLRSGCVRWGPAPQNPRAGLTRYVFWGEWRSPCRPEPPLPSMETADLSRSQKLVELTLRSRHATFDAGATIALWRATQRDRGVCVFEAVASPPPTGMGGDNPPMGTGYCSRSELLQTPPGKSLAVGLGSSREKDGSHSWLLSGHVDPSAGVSRLELHTRSGIAPVAFDNGYFLAELGTSAMSGQLPDGPQVLVAYGADGNEIAREDLKERYGAGRPG